MARVNSGKAIAIITARGGSKRISRKNIKEFCGKPMIAYSIEAALASGVFEEVMVSTEDEEIAEIAKQYGAKVPFMRSHKNADDFSTTADVLDEVLTTYEKRESIFSYACCIYPTAPFVTGEKLRSAMEMLKESEVDSVIPVTAFSFPPMRGMYVEKEKLRYAFPEYQMKRSQDIPPMYHDCGQFYCFRVQEFLKSKSLTGANTKAMILPEMEVQDIDGEQDWKLAELKYQLMLLGKEREIASDEAGKE